MINRGNILGALALIMVLITLSFVSGASSTSSCATSVKLVNQDPYPATPGDYVKLVFQIDGLSDPSCGNVVFELKNKYPISFDPGVSNSYSVSSGVFQVDYGSFATVPFKVRVDKDAVDGDNRIETSLSNTATGTVLYNFTISIKDLKSDFDVYVKNYNAATNILTLEIINIGKVNVKAIAMTILPESDVQVKGPSKNVVGDLDSNEYTTADFEVSGKGMIRLNIDYTDESGIRRSIQKTVSFDPSAFEGRKADQKSVSPITYIIVGIIILVIAFLIYRRYRNKHR